MNTNVLLKNKDGDSAIKFAVRNGNIAIIDFIIKKSKDDPEIIKEAFNAANKEEDEVIKEYLITNYQSSLEKKDTKVTNDNLFTKLKNLLHRGATEGANYFSYKPKQKTNNNTRQK